MAGPDGCKTFVRIGKRPYFQKVTHDQLLVKFCLRNGKKLIAHFHPFGGRSVETHCHGFRRRCSGGAGCAWRVGHGVVESPVYAILDMNKALAKLDGRDFGGTTAHVELFNISMPTDDREPAIKGDVEWQVKLEVFRDLGLD